MQIILKNLKYLIFILSVVVLIGCSEYSKVLKKGTLDEKQAYANKAYKKKDYVRALPLYEELLAAYRGKPESEEIYFYYCYSNYGQGQYELAAYHFKNFTENYFNSKHSEECAFMYAKSIYKQTKPYFLDQTSTQKAIDEVQLFLNVYPESIYKEEGNNIITELRGLLQNKAFQTAMLYYKIEDYKASILCFKNAIKAFPDIENKDEIEYLILKSSYMFAKYSVIEEKSIRYESVFSYYKEYFNKRTPSPFEAQAKDIYNSSEQELIKHKKSINIL